MLHKASMQSTFFLVFFLFLLSSSYGTTFSSSPRDVSRRHLNAFGNHNPTVIPSIHTTMVPTQPTGLPTKAPTNNPIANPTGVPTDEPTAKPTKFPTFVPSSFEPTELPTTGEPTGEPTNYPTSSFPSQAPSDEPTDTPTFLPTQPTASPTLNPTVSQFPTARNSKSPTISPTVSQSPTTASPTFIPPTGIPTLTRFPTAPTSSPSVATTLAPSAKVTTAVPTVKPSSLAPTKRPSTSPSSEPTTFAPSAQPTDVPSAQPSALPTDLPSALPSALPTAVPSALPTAEPTALPSALPTAVPSALPTAEPSAFPTVLPTAIPTAAPTSSLYALILTGSTISGSTIYTTSQSGGIYVSTDNAVHWTAIPGLPELNWLDISSDVAGTNIVAVGYAFASPDYLWAYVSTDGGNTFTKRSIIVLDTLATLPETISVSVAETGRFYVVYGQNSQFVEMYLTDGHFVLRGKNEYYYTSVASDQASGVYSTAVTQFGDIVSSADTGILYTIAATGLGNLVSVAISSNGQFQVTGGSNGVYLSSTYGSINSWFPVTAPFTAVSAVAIDPAADTIAVAAVSGATPGIYVTQDFGSSWTLVFPSSLSVSGLSLNQDGSGGFAATTTTGGFYFTTSV